MQTPSPVLIVFCAAVVALASVWWHQASCSRDRFGAGASASVAAPAAIAPPKIVSIAWQPVIWKDWKVEHKVGTGAGRRHAGFREHLGRPFPTTRGIVLQFSVFFEPNFEWGCGGKIGGLFMGTSGGGGGDHQAYASSARVMWQKDGGAIAYVYVPKGTERQQRVPELRAPGAYGTGLFKNEYANAFTTGAWHTVQIGIKPNTLNASDGELFFSIGREGKAMKGRLLRGIRWWQPLPNISANRSITRLEMNLFHGGPCWAQRHSVSRYKNIKVGYWV